MSLRHGAITGSADRLTTAGSRRYDVFDPDDLRDRSKGPKVSPLGNSGRGRFQDRLPAFELPRRAAQDPDVSRSLSRHSDPGVGIWRILKRLDINRLPSSQRYKRHRQRSKRYEKQRSGRRIQLDVKFIAPLKGSRRGRYYQFTAVTIAFARAC